MKIGKDLRKSLLYNKDAPLTTIYHLNTSAGTHI